MKNILVTGGAGFIGNHLCRFLLSKGNNVFCIDNLYSGSEKNIEDLLKNPRFKFIRHDITTLNADLFKEEIHQIYNLACPASPIYYQADPIGTLKANTIGVINILEFAKQKNAKILQTSTSEVYGDPIEHPQKESYRGNVSPTGPRACYDEGKRVAETLFMEYHRKHNLNIRIARIFNTYGPNMREDDGRVVSNFIVQAIKNEPITVYGEGNQTRSFCFVDDLIEGLYQLMESDYTEHVNLGNPSEFTILQLAEKVIGLVNSKSKIIYERLPTDDPTRRNPDISLAKRVLKWEPKIQLEDGLKPTIDYFRKKIISNNRGRSMRIGIMGAGFVGGTTAKIFENVHEVIIYDKYKEPYTNPERLKEAEVVFICVPTPMKISGELDYSSIHDSLGVLKEVTSQSENKPLVVIRSTAVSGSTDSLEKIYPFNFVFNPEFLREKHALEDMQNTNRVIIGANRNEDYQKVEEVYRALFPDAEYIQVDRKIAEMIKYASNAMLTGQIAIANELYQICNSINIDYNQIKKVLLMDDRMARNIDVPGPDGDLGFGGKCFPKDLNALIYLSRENGYRPHLFEEIWMLNDRVRKNKDWLNIKGAVSDNNYQ